MAVRAFIDARSFRNASRRGRRHSKGLLDKRPGPTSAGMRNGRRLADDQHGRAIQALRRRAEVGQGGQHPPFVLQARPLHDQRGGGGRAAQRRSAARRWPRRWTGPCRWRPCGCGLARAAQSRSGSPPEAAWPVTKVTAWARPRWVSGAPAPAAAARAALTPGTTWHCTPAARQACKLLAAAAEHERIAALQAHHGQALAGEADDQGVDVVLRQGVTVLALAHVDQARAAGPASARIGGGVSRSCTTTSAAFSRLQGLDGQQLGVARAGAHQPNHARAAALEARPFKTHQTGRSAVVMGFCGA